MLRNKLLALFLLCTLLLTACAQQQPATAPTEYFPSKAEITYKTTAVTRGPFSLTVQCNGNFTYPLSRQLTSEYANAILTESIIFPEGAEFKKGDIIATFTFNVSQAELDRLELEYYQSNLSVANQIQTYENRISQYTQAAAAGGIDGQIAALQLERTRNELKLYKERSYATLVKQSEELEAYRDLFTPKTLVAPEDGTVINAVSINAGTTLQKGSLILTYTTGNPRLLLLNNPSQEFQLLATPGMKVTISRGSQEIAGFISASPTGIADTLNNMYIYVDSPAMAELEPRSYYKVQCTVLQLSDMLLLDASAVHYDENAAYVMLLEDGNAVKREILCGLEDDGLICVLDGLEEGQLVITNY